MGSWWAHCIQKEGLKFDQKLKGIFWVILYEPWWARKRRLYYLWLLSGAYEPSKGFLPFLVGKSIISRKKREPCLSPHARGLMFCVSKILGGPSFWNVSFFLKTPVVLWCFMRLVSFFGMQYMSSSIRSDFPWTPMKFNRFSRKKRTFDSSLRQLRVLWWLTWFSNLHRLIAAVDHEATRSARVMFRTIPWAVNSM